MARVHLPCLNPDCSNPFDIQILTLKVQILALASNRTALFDKAIPRRGVEIKQYSLIERHAHSLSDNIVYNYCKSLHLQGFIHPKFRPKKVG